MCGRMKFLKRLLFVAAFLFMAGCAGILVCAFNPSLTAKLAEKIEGSSDTSGEGTGGEQQPGNPAGDRSPEGGETEDIRQPDTTYADPVQPGINTGWRRP